MVDAPSPSEARSLVLTKVAPYLAALAVAALFWPARAFDFINFDDPIYLLENPQVRAGLTPAGVIWAFTTFHGGNWHPLTWLSHMADWELFGAWAGGHHLVNVVLHAGSVFLLCRFLLGIVGRAGAAIGATLFFGIHPLRVESVAWVAERKDVLSVFFLMWVLDRYVAYVRDGRRRDLGLTHVVLGIGLLAKPMLVTVPFLLLLLDRAFLNRPSSRSGSRPFGLVARAREMALLFVFSGASCLITIWAQWQGGAVKSMAAVSLGLRLQNAAVVPFVYLRQTVWPVDLAVFYPLPGERPLATVLGCAAGLIVISAGAWRGRGRFPWLVAGWFWFLVGLLPVIGLVQVGDQAHADRYTYLPSIGLSFILVGMAWEARRRWGTLARIAVPLFALAGFAALAAMTWGHLAHWQDSGALFRRALQVTGDNPTALLYLGNFDLEQDRPQEAEARFRRILDLSPHHLEGLTNLGISLARQGHHGEALKILTQARERSPDHARILNNLASVSRELGETDRALTLYLQALANAPDNREVLSNLGGMFESLDQFDQARAYYEKAIAVDPRYAQAYNGLGVVAARQGDLRGARDLFQRALVLQPGFVDASINLRRAEAGVAAEQERASAGSAAGGP